MHLRSHQEGSLFGTDGIRGVANRYPITPEVALQLGRAIAWVAGEGKPHPPRIVIGKDTRLSGYMLETALASGICSMGGRVLLCGPLPTPGVAHLTASMRADAGVVISASHNPYTDNGIKLFDSQGFKLSDALQARVEQFVLQALDPGIVVQGERIGRAIKLDDAPGRYVVFAKSTFPREVTLEGLHVVLDAAHGAAYKVAPMVFSELGAQITPLGVNPNGTNINQGVGALHPAKVQAEVRKRGAHVGIALDGDADRVVLVDETGAVLDGDFVLAMCAQQMLHAGLLKKNKVVATVMSNFGLEQGLARHGIALLRTPVGDRHVVQAMRHEGLNLGGEQSGHLIFLDHASTGDGIVAALQVLALMQQTGRPLSHLAQEAMERVPQVLRSVRLPRKIAVEEMPILTHAAAQIEKELGHQGRLLLRWSGTEPKLRIMLEGPYADRLAGWAEELSSLAEKACAV